MTPRVMLSSARHARRAGDRAARGANWLKGLFRHAPVKWNGEVFVRFRGEAIVLIRRRWLFLTLATSQTISQYFLYCSSGSARWASRART
jgi:hypothetical protein